MDAQKDHLASHYEGLDTEELLRLHQGGALTDLAYEVLESELRNRGAPVPVRPLPIEETYKHEGFLRAYWSGRKPLWGAYWLIGVIGIPLALSIGLLAGLLLTKPKLESDDGFILFVAITLVVFTPYFIFACVSIWRCANNVGWKGWGVLARIVVAALVLRYFFTITGQI
jgi:hypothetical protein